MLTWHPIYDSGKDWSAGFFASFDFAWHFFRIRTRARSSILKPTASTLLLCARCCAWRTTKGNILRTSSESLNSRASTPRVKRIAGASTFEMGRPYLCTTSVTSYSFYISRKNRVDRQLTRKMAFKLIFLTQRRYNM